MKIRISPSFIYQDNQSDMYAMIRTYENELYKTYDVSIEVKLSSNRPPERIHFPYLNNKGLVEMACHANSIRERRMGNNITKEIAYDVPEMTELVTDIKNQYLLTHKASYDIDFEDDSLYVDTTKAKENDFGHQKKDWLSYELYRYLKDWNSTRSQREQIGSLLLFEEYEEARDNNTIDPIYYAAYYIDVNSKSKEEKREYLLGIACIIADCIRSNRLFDDIRNPSLEIINENEKQAIVNAYNKHGVKSYLNKIIEILTSSNEFCDIIKKWPIIGDSKNLEDAIKRLAVCLKTTYYSEYAKDKKFIGATIFLLYYAFIREVELDWNCFSENVIKYMNLEKVTSISYKPGALEKMAYIMYKYSFSYDENRVIAMPLNDNGFWKQLPEGNISSLTDYFSFFERLPRYNKYQNLIKDTCYTTDKMTGKPINNPMSLKAVRTRYKV